MDVCKAHVPSLSVGQKKVIRYVIYMSTVSVLLLIITYTLQQIPHWQVSHFGITNPKDLADIENSYRITLVQTLGGVAIGVGLYYTWRRVTIAENELKVSLQGQITERFTRAVDQLGAIDQSGSPALEIRLGGIYALERISKESEEDYWPIMEILTAYVRKNSSIEVIKNKGVTSISMDIKAILDVFKRRSIEHEDSDFEFFNLDHTYLANAKLDNIKLPGAYLQEVDLIAANLKEADFKNAHLERANLTGAHLEGANLSNANLEGANLTNSYLEGADLTNSLLGGAILINAHLKKAKLTHANLNGANLNKAHLEDANLTESKMNGTKLIKANLKGANLTDTIMRFADLTDADFTGALLKNTTFIGAILKGANFEESNFEKTKFSKNDIHQGKFPKDLNGILYE